MTTTSAPSPAFFGWEALVISRDDGAARLTTSAYRVARGALEYLPVYADDSAVRLVVRIAAVVAHGAPAMPTIGADHRSTKTICTYGGLKGAIALVLGNEEKGLSPAVRSACSELVRIDGAGAIESLNVSQAAAVFLYELAPGRP
jgi:TrmH RNA methyltransferase